MNKVIIPLVVVIIVVAVGALLFKNQSASTKMTAAPTQSAQQVSQKTSPSAMQSSDSAAKSAATVEYTSAGFNPKSVTIKAGQTVTWKNKDEDGMWVASNPHPTHTDYPGFDELKQSPTNGMYSFTFTKVGTWGYHNHLNPAQKGEVLVTQ